MKFIYYFYYHYLDNPSIEYCVYVDIQIKGYVLDTNLIDYNTFEIEIKNIINDIYQVFLMDNNIQINANYSIFEQNSTTISNVSNFIYYTNETIKNILDSLYMINSGNKKNNIIEWGNKFNIESSWSSNIKDIINDNNKSYTVTRIEKYSRIQLSNLQYFNTNYDKIVHDNFSYLKGKLNYILNNLSNTKKILDGTQLISFEELKKVNSTWGLALDYNDINWFKGLYDKLERKLTKLEIYDLAQSNSEHSRHWIFNSKIIIDNEEYDTKKTMFNMVRHTLKNTKDYNSKFINKDNSVLAFCDNSSAINGVLSLTQHKNIKSKSISYDCKNINATLTAETHNFPTGIAPFEGANTGVGGRIRDSLATGIGADIIASLAGYCVANLNPSDSSKWNYSSLPQTPETILIKASNGASDYGNKVGEPIIGGFCRSVGIDLQNIDGTTDYLHFFKPIMFNAGLGYVYSDNTYKLLEDSYIIQDNNSGIISKKYIDEELLICNIGGPAYPVGLGGGSSSSLNQSSDAKYDNAVQRGDAEMGCRLVNFFRTLNNSSLNPIVSLHDQGAGGPANVVKELVELTGGEVYLDNFNLGDKTMTPLQIYCSEFQEQCCFLIKREDYNYVKSIADLENIKLCIIGKTYSRLNNNNTDKRINVYKNNPYKQGDRRNCDQPLVSLPIDYALSNVPQKSLYCNSQLPSRLNKNHCNYISFTDLPIDIRIKSINKSIKILLSSVSICSKKFLVNKVDRSVTGLIAQQQCVGPNQLPLSNYSINKLDYFTDEGVVSSIGEGSINGLCNDYTAFSHRIIAEMLTNLMGCVIPGMEYIKCSANWMWSPKHNSKEAYKLVKAVEALCEGLIECNIAIDGGKDSVSMVSNVENNETDKYEKVISPPTLVLTSYTTIKDIYNRVTPEFKDPGNTIIYIPMNVKPTFSLGGSNYQLLIENSIYGEATTITDFQYFKNVFTTVQGGISSQYIKALHDVSDGGLITTLLEMSFVGSLGFYCDINLEDNLPMENFLFSEECGVVLEVDKNYLDTFCNILEKNNITHTILGRIITETIELKINSNEIINSSILLYRYQWELPSFELEKHQMSKYLIDEEMHMISYLSKPKITIPDNVMNKLEECNTHIHNITLKDISNDEYNQPTVLILRDVGSNGHREMIFNFYLIGFKVYEKTMVELNNNPKLDKYNGIVFVGGFSNADVPSSGSGWAYSLMNNINIRENFVKFLERPDTFTLGICNGCQVINKMEYISGDFNLINNASSKFESRWSYIRIEDDDNIFFRGMGGLQFGIWTAHGEGNFQLNNPNKSILDVNYRKVASYVNPYLDEDTESIDGKHNLYYSNETILYPHNPNGSIDNIVGLVSHNGRHLMMMPHPERCTINYQIPYLPEEISSRFKNEGIKITPWMIIFKNLYDFCMESEVTSF